MTVTDNIRRLAAALAVAFLVVSLGVGYWQVVAADELGRDPYNPRLYVAAISQPRGTIVDRDGNVLAKSTPSGSRFQRSYASPLYEPMLGYATLAFGASGIEASYATSLIGEDPGDPIAALRRRYLEERTPPGTVKLALSAKLQQLAAQQLGNSRGAIIALDPRTGEILASVSSPRYDANPLVDPQRQRAAFDALNNDANHPFLDRATQGLYPPGSTFKIVTGAAGLESGAIDPNAQVRVDSPWRADPSWGTYSVPSPSNAHGNFDLSLAYQRSENIYFAMAAVRMGGANLADYAGRFMLGKDLGLDGPYSRTQLSSNGKLDTPTLVAATGFGQGQLLVSPLQMALIVSTIADGGVMPTPHYALEVRDGSGAVIRRIQPGPLAQPIRPETARIIATDLVAAVEAPGAFAYPAKIAGVHVAGKTGTAESPNGIMGWFVGYAPAEAPTIAVAVVIEGAPNGGLDGAAAGGAVMRAWLGK